MRPILIGFLLLSSLILGLNLLSENGSAQISVPNPPAGTVEKQPAPPPSPPPVEPNPPKVVPGNPGVCTRAQPAITVDRNGNATMKDCNKCHVNLSVQITREAINLDQAAESLAQQIRQKPDDAKLKELKKLVEQSFTKRHESQIADAEILKAKLDKLLTLLKKREEKKAEIIERRMKQLLGDIDDLEWNPSGTKQQGKGMIPAPSSPLIDFDITQNPGVTIAVPARIGNPAPVRVPNYPAAQSLEALPPLAQPLQENPLAPAPSQPTPTVPPSPVMPAPDMAMTVLKTSSVGMVAAKEDVRLLEIELALAKNLLEAEKVEMSRLEKNVERGLISKAEVQKQQFQVRQKELEMQMVERRLQIARDKENAAKKKKESGR